MNYIAPSTINTLNWLPLDFIRYGSQFTFIMNVIEAFCKRCCVWDTLLDAEGVDIMNREWDGIHDKGERTFGKCWGGG